jgi:hypothetical protein
MRIDTANLQEMEAYKKQILFSFSTNVPRVYFLKDQILRSSSSVQYYLKDHHTSDLPIFLHHM